MLPSKRTPNKNIYQNKVEPGKRQQQSRSSEEPFHWCPLTVWQRTKVKGKPLWRSLLILSRLLVPSKSHRCTYHSHGWNDSMTCLLCGLSNSHRYKYGHQSHKWMKSTEWTSSRTALKNDLLHLNRSSIYWYRSLFLSLFYFASCTHEKRGNKTTCLS